MLKNLLNTHLVEKNFFGILFLIILRKASKLTMNDVKDVDYNVLFIMY